MTDAMQTIREALEAVAIEYPDNRPGMDYEGPLPVFAKKCMVALIALDSLAVGPSEDVCQLTNEIIDCCVSYWRTRNQAIGLSIWKKATALIQARDELVRRECADRAVEWVKDQGLTMEIDYNCYEPNYDQFRAAILTPEATNGQ